MASNHRLAAAAVRVVDELVQLHAAVWADIQIGLVVEAKTSLARLVGADRFVCMHTSTRRERSTHAAVRSWRNAVGRADLLTS